MFFNHSSLISTDFPLVFPITSAINVAFHQFFRKIFILTLISDENLPNLNENVYTHRLCHAAVRKSQRTRTRETKMKIVTVQVKILIANELLYSLNLLSVYLLLVLLYF